MRPRYRTLTIISLIALLSITAVRADVPTNMNVQGRLTDGSGTPVAPGFKQFTFKIFDAAIGGVEIWPAGPGENQAVATDADGLWNASVGGVIPLTESVFQDTARWLEITVDDGVNPPETLDRIKLNTNPYSYRSASSQQADAVGGKTPADLDADYVNVPGDVMTGLLEAPTFRAGNPGLDGSIEVWANGFTDPIVVAGRNASFDGGELRLQDESGNRMIFGEPDADGDGGFFAVNGTAPEDPGHAFLVDANYMGSGDPVVYINGSGAYSSFSTLAPGPGSVHLPDNAIEAREIYDEPGLTSSPLGGVISIGTTDTLIATATANFPTRGYVIIFCEGTFQTLTVGSFLDCHLYRNGSVIGHWYWDPGDADPWYDLRQTMVFTDTITTGGFDTYDLRVRANTGSAAVTEGKVTALFVPTAYGPVALPTATNNSTDLSGTELTRQQVSQSGAIDRDASIQEAVAFHQAQLEEEMTQMKADMEALKSQLRNMNQITSNEGSDR